MAKHGLLILFVLLVACNTLISIVVGARYRLYLTGSSARKNEKIRLSKTMRTVQTDFWSAHGLSDPELPETETETEIETDVGEQYESDSEACSMDNFVTEDPCRDATCDSQTIVCDVEGCKCSTEVFPRKHPKCPPFCIEVQTALLYTDQGDTEEEDYSSDSTVDYTPFPGENEPWQVDSTD